MNELLRVTFYRKNKGPCLVTISSVRVSKFRIKIEKGDLVGTISVVPDTFL